MKNSNTRARSMTLAVLIGSAVISGMAIAADQLAEVTIQGSRMTKVVTPGVPLGGPHDETTTLSKTASYSDLDLSTVNGAQELEARVTATAKELCVELDKLFSREPACVKDVTDKAMVQVHKAVKSAVDARSAASKAAAKK